MTRSCPSQPQVSVIVPVYNQERYLEECINSIRRQTLTEWECLIVNDGSSDSSGEIARRFSKADSRIRCFEQEVSRAIARCRSVALTSEKFYHYGLGGPQSVSSRNRKAETRPASYYAVFEMLTREKLREGVLGSNRTAYMNYIVPLLFPDNEMPAGRLRHWAELWREAGITSEHVCGIPREQRAYLEAALAGRWIYLRFLQCFWKFKTARRKMFRLRFSKNGIDTLQILGCTLYSAKRNSRSSL